MLKNANVMQQKVNYQGDPSFHSKNNNKTNTNTNTNTTTNNKNTYRFNNNQCPNWNKNEESNVLENSTSNKNTHETQPPSEGYYHLDLETKKSFDYVPENDLLYI